MQKYQRPALVIVDMQRYYLDESSAFHRYSTYKNPASMKYISRRCHEVVIPNIQKLLKHFRQYRLPVVFLKLCSSIEDRSDLHSMFRKTNEVALLEGFFNVYPLLTDPMADVIPEFETRDSDIIIQKTTFSPFTRTSIKEILKKNEIESLYFTGLATSQCVDTTARDASEHGFTVVHVIDAQADYDEYSHNASLYGSIGVCGGLIYSTKEVLESDNKLLTL